MLTINETNRFVWKKTCKIYAFMKRFIVSISILSKHKLKFPKLIKSHSVTPQKFVDTCVTRNKCSCLKNEKVEWQSDRQRLPITQVQISYYFISTQMSLIVLFFLSFVNLFTKSLRIHQCLYSSKSISTEYTEMKCICTIFYYFVRFYWILHLLKYCSNTVKYMYNLSSLATITNMPENCMRESWININYHRYKSTTSALYLFMIQKSSRCSKKLNRHSAL